MISIYGFYSYKDYRMQEERYLQSQINNFSSRLNSTISVYKNFSDFIFYEISNDKNVINILKVSNDRDLETRNELRKYLIKKLENTYKSMCEHGFSGLQFHLNNGSSFLRFHDLNMNGDDLTNIRESISKVGSEHVFIEGFESGRIFNAYRFIYPIFDNDIYIASVEIILDISSIIENLTYLYPEYDFYFLVKNEILNSKMDKKYRENYIKSPVFSDYSYYSSGENFTEINYKYRKAIKENAKKIKTSLEEKYRKKQDFSQNHLMNDREYNATFIRVNSISGDEIGYLSSVSEDHILNEIHTSFIKNLFLTTLIIILLLVKLIHLMITKKSIEESSQMDFLTQIYNRNKISEVISYEFEMAKRFGDKFCIMMLDIDNFKSINDTYGHNIGDIVLKEFSSLVAQRVRNTDSIGRWGGEEFIIILPKTNVNGALILAREINYYVAQHQFTKCSQQVTVSIGISEFSTFDSSDTQIIERADKALYYSKNNGRNRATSWHQVVQKSKTSSPKG